MCELRDGSLITSVRDKDQLGISQLGIRTTNLETERYTVYSMQSKPKKYRRSIYVLRSHMGAMSMKKTKGVILKNKKSFLKMLGQS